MTALVYRHFPAGGSLLSLALALADHAHNDGDNIYPGVASLALKVRQSERAVQYGLRRLQKMGWLQLVEEARGGRPSTTEVGRRRNRPRRYRINPAWIAAPACFFKEIGARVAPISTRKSVQPDALIGAIAIAPEPSLESSKNPRTQRSLHRCAFERDGARCEAEGIIGQQDGRRYCRQHDREVEP